MNKNVVKIVKIAGTLLSVAGMIATQWAGDKQVNSTIEKIVDAKMNKEKKMREVYGSLSFLVLKGDLL